MDGYTSLGLGSDIRSEGPGPGQFETPMAMPAAEQAGKAWDRQVLEPGREEMAVLDGVRGYAAATMSKNVNGRWGLSNNRDLLYDLQDGPTKGATVVGDGTIRLDEPGVWTVHVLAHARATNYTAGVGSEDVSQVHVRLHAPGGQIIRSTMLEDPNGAKPASIGQSLPFRVVEEGSYISVLGWSARWRWWDGGLRYSHLVVVKNDNRTENQAPDTVPDEEES